MITVDGLTYHYANRGSASPGTPALNQVSVEFHAGQITLIAGASGSGKSTLARCINGLIPRNYARGRLQGAIKIDGRDIRPLSLAQLSGLIGTVLQDPEKQIVAADVTSEIAFGLENLGVPRGEMLPRVRAAAAQLGISALLERSTFEISGGERQKVALAGVLAIRPRVLLLDEPLASLDPASARETMALLRALADEGVAVLVIEHRLKTVLAARPEQIVTLAHGARIATPPMTQIYGGANGAPAPSTPGSAPILALQAVTFGYPGGQTILNGIDLAIRPGERIALLGANGAGKTTLCKHLIGLNRPAAGRVLVDGRDASALTVAELARIVGFVFQSPGYMLFAPTLREELAFGPVNLKLAPETIARNTQRAALSMGLEDRLADSPFALSYGQQKRASIASILAMGPRVLVMDEPTAGQDSDSVARFMGDIARDPQIEALIFATHDLDLARAYANRILVLHEGRLVADGPPEAVLADANLLVRCRLA